MLRTSTCTNKYNQGNYHAEKISGRKLGLFGHKCRTHNSRKIKEMMFGKMDGTKQERKTPRGMAGRYRRLGQGVTPGAEPRATDRSWKSLAKMASHHQAFVIALV